MIVPVALKLKARVLSICKNTGECCLSFSRDELKQVMKQLGDNVTEAEIDQMIKNADTDKDGKVNYNGK